MKPNTPENISLKSQDSLLQYTRQCYNLLNNQWDIRSQMQVVDRAYQREMDWTDENNRAKQANRAGDANKIQNFTIPVVMPQVEAAVTYQASVFLTGVPIFGVVSDPSNQDAATQMETIIQENAIRGAWVKEFLMFFRDGEKYNLNALEVSWETCKVPTFETDIAFSPTQGKPKEILWEGNKIKRLDLYNTFFDSRVAPSEMHIKGEFAGYTELLSRIELKAYINNLGTAGMIANYVKAFEAPLTGSGNFGAGIQSFFIPNINPNSFLNRDPRAEFNWMSWVNLESTDNRANINYRNYYERTIIYAKILPSDFGIKVPQASSPQIWKLVYINHSVLIYAERQTNAHNYLPIIMGQPLEDGLRYQTKSSATNVQPIQEISSALMNGVLAARRRSISDRVLFDPSRVAPEHINNANPSAKIPVRPAAFGKSVSEAVYAFPFRDENSQMSMQEIQQLNNFANIITGSNPVRQGQFVKGNKTLSEFSDVMSHANGRDQLKSMLYEAQVFSPLKEILKINILQYQPAGEVYSVAEQRAVTINPLELRKATLNFKISDGLIPSEKLVSNDALALAFQAIAGTPGLQQGYNLAPLFSYFMKNKGAELKPFEKSPEQLAYEQAMATWQQTVLEAIKAGAQQANLPPQPLPQQYNYVPGQLQAAPQGQLAQVRNSVNNITNNITNSEGQ